jgi:hypothetical protein
MKRNIRELNLADLLALHDSIDRGIIEAYSTDQLWWSYNNSTSDSKQAEVYKKMIDDREEKLRGIRDAMRDRAKEYEY